MWTKVLIFYFVLLGVFFSALFFGPRVKIDTSLEKPGIPARLSSLDAWLANKEKQFKDLRPGTDKKIVWAFPGVKKKTRLSIVYLHGFTATRQEIAPVPELVAKSLQANLFYTRLRGHGRSGEALANVSVNEWFNDGYEALLLGKKLGDKVIVMGCSTGATLAMWLGGQKQLSSLISAFVLVSPNFEPKNKSSRLLVKPWGREIARLVTGGKRSWKPANALQGKYWTTSYPSDALLPMMALVKALGEVELSRITQPLMMIYSPKDQVIDTALVEKRFPLFGSTKKKLVAVNDTSDRSAHILTGRIMSPQTVAPMSNQITAFLHKNLPVSGQGAKNAPTVPRSPGKTRSAPVRRKPASR